MIDGQFATVINPLTPETLENEKWLVISGIWTPTGTQKDATQGDIENLQIQIGDLNDLNTPVIIDLVQSINSVYSQKGQASGLATLDTQSEIPYANIKDTYVNIIGTLLGTSPTVTELPTANTERMTAYWYNSNVEFEDPSGLIFRRRGEIAYNVNPISTNPTWLKTDSATIFTVNGILPDVDGDIEVMIEDIFGLREELDTKAFIVNNLDNPNDADSLNTEQLVLELAQKSSAINNNSATGILELPTITINAGDDTALDIGVGRFRFVKFVNDILTTFNIDTPASTISLKNIGTQTNSTVYYFLDVNNNAVLGTDNGIVDPIQFRNKAYFGIAFHPQSVIMSAFPIGFYVNMPTNQLIDFVFSGNKSNSNVEGNNYSGVVATRELFVSSGKIRGFGFNLQNSLTDPNTSIQPSDSSFDFTIAYRDGAGGLTFEIVNAVPNTYDDGSGVLATIPGGAQASANYTIFRSGRFNNDIPGLTGSATFILMPQTTYANITGAVAGFVAGETFNNIPGFIFSVVVQRYNLSARSGGVDFTSESDAIFKEIVLGGSGGSGGSGPSSVNASAVINDSANAEVLARGSNQDELNISIIQQQDWNSIPQLSAFVNVGGNVFEIRASMILTPQLNQSFILNFNPTGGLDGDLITVSIDAGVSSFPLVITSGQQLTYKQITSKTRLIGGSINAPIRFTGTSYAWDDYLTMESNGNFLMSADMSMNGFKITDLDVPFNDDDATTKKFVEDLVNVETYDTLDDDTETLPQIVMTDKGIEVSSTIVAATNLVVNGSLGNTYTTDGATSYRIKDDGTFIVTSSNTTLAQEIPIVLGNKYFIKVKSNDALGVRNQVLLRYDSGTIQSNGANDTDVQDFSGLITATETNLANAMFRGTSDIAGNPHQILGFCVVEITPTSPLFNLTASELDNIFPNPFDNTVSSDYTILSENKNILDTFNNIEIGSYNPATGTKSASPESYRSKDFIDVKPSSPYISTHTNVDVIGTRYFEYDINFNFIGNVDGTLITTTANTRYINFRLLLNRPVIQDEWLNDELQIEQNTVSTPFIPYYADPNLVGGVVQREYNALRTFIDGRILIQINPNGIGGINSYSIPTSIGAERAMHSRVINSANIDIKRLNDRISLITVTGALVTDIATIYQDITVSRLQVDVSGTFHDVLHADSSFYLYGSVDIAEVIESAITVNIRYLKVTL